MGRWQSEACSLLTAWAEWRQLQLAHWSSQAPWWNLLEMQKYARLIVNVVRSSGISGFRVSSACRQANAVASMFGLLTFSDLSAISSWLEECESRVLLEFCYFAGSEGNKWYSQQSFKLLLQHQIIVCSTSVFWLNGFGDVTRMGHKAVH